MTDPTLEAALRRAVFWARRGIPHTATELLAGTGGVLQYRPEHRDLAASLPGGEKVRVQLSPARRRVTITRTAAAYELTGSADLPSHLVECAGVSADTSSLAGALALAFGHGPLAGIAPALVVEREGSTFKVRAAWGVLDGSVALEARGLTLDACHEKIARQVLRLWPALEEAAEWL